MSLRREDIDSPSGITTLPSIFRARCCDIGVSTTYEGGDVAMGVPVITPGPADRHGSPPGVCSGLAVSVRSAPGGGATSDLFCRAWLGSPGGLGHGQGA